MAQSVGKAGSKPKGGRLARVLAGVAIGLMVALLLAFAGVNIFVKVTYGPFFAQAEREFAIPGIEEGFIPQDLDCLEDGTWIFSGYMTEGGPSPLYFLKPDGSTGSFQPVRVDGSDYGGHGSGITSDGVHVFLTDDEGILAFDLTDVQAVQDGGLVQATARRSLEFAPAFLNIEEDIMFLGNFYHPGAYETPEHHRLDTPGGDWNPAVMYAYPASPEAELGYEEQAACVYSIPARIQGMCLADANHLVLSQSYGLNSSHLLVYDLVSATLDETVLPTAVFFADGREVPLYYLDTLSLVEDIQAPPMSEGIEWHDGRVFISCESASDKYLFGKIYGCNAVYGLRLEEG